MRPLELENPGSRRTVAVCRGKGSEESRRLNSSTAGGTLGAPEPRSSVSSFPGPLPAVLVTAVVRHIQQPWLGRKTLFSTAL